MIKFGTGGFRAIIGDDFTKANVELLAQGLVNKMKVEKVEDSPLIIGYDRLLPVGHRRKVDLRRLRRQRHPRPVH